jgi:N-terminal domain of ribose phosphate pyrophosphokinase
MRPTILSGTANNALAGAMAVALGTVVRDCNITRFPDGELGISILESVRGDDIFLIFRPHNQMGHRRRRGARREWARSTFKSVVPVPSHSPACSITDLRHITAVTARAMPRRLKGSDGYLHGSTASRAERFVAQRACARGRVDSSLSQVGRSALYQLRRERGT